MQELATQQPAPVPEEVMTLTEQDLADLRRKVLMKQQLTLKEARAVVAHARKGRVVAVLAGEAKPKKGTSKKSAMSDEALDADLDSALGL